MGVPTTGETFAKLIEHLRKAEEDAAMMGHLVADEDPLRQKGWYAVSEMLRLTVVNVTKLATGESTKWN